MAGNLKHKKQRQALQNVQLKSIKTPLFFPSPQPLAAVFQRDGVVRFYLEAFTPSRREQVTDFSLKRTLHDSPFPSPLLLSSVVLLCAGGIRLLECVHSSLCQLFTLFTLPHVFSILSLLPSPPTPPKKNPQIKQEKGKAEQSESCLFPWYRKTKIFSDGRCVLVCCE